MNLRLLLAIIQKKYGSRNENGDRLAQFAASNDLFLSRLCMELSLIETNFVECTTRGSNARTDHSHHYWPLQISLSPASKLVFPSSGILSVQKRHQGLKNKRWDFQRSYKSLKTAVILRPDLTNFLPWHTSTSKFHTQRTLDFIATSNQNSINYNTTIST